MDRKSELAAAWDRNAENWTRAVRDGLIASRKAGSDEAIVSAIVARRPARLLDVGCGEGWLIRRVCALTGCEAVGIDGTASLIERASEADPRNHYLVLSYDALIAGAPHDFEHARPVVPTEPANRTCKGPSVEEVRRRVRRVHRRTLGKQVTLGRLSR